MKLTRNQVLNLVLSAAIPVIFCLVILLFYPFETEFQFNPDEGLELEKVQMMMKGYPLYDSIWNDQPPMFTLLLGGVFRLFGTSVNTARVTVILLSAALIWGAFEFLYMAWGAWEAILGALLLILLPFYLQLSASVMRGLPALTFAVLSLTALAAWHKRRNWLWLILSAVLLAVSILIKLFTGFLVPIFGIGLILDEFRHAQNPHRWWKVLRPALVWGLVCLGIGLFAILFIIGIPNLDQVVLAPLKGVVAEQFGKAWRYSLYANLLGRLFLILSLLSVPYIFRFKNWLSLYVLAWLAFGYIFLLNYQPVWYHLQLLILVPAAMLGGLSLGSALRTLSRNLQSKKWITLSNLYAVGVLIVGLALAVQYVPEFYQQLQPVESTRGAAIEGRSQPNLFSADLYAIVQSEAPHTEWMVTDLPMYAFRSSLPVPPNTVVVSEKRITSRLFSQNDMLQYVMDYQPEMVLFGRFNFSRVERYLKENYARVYTSGDLKLYIKN
jgi:4-amino-4-deoxy-L-arabinose transferase-like glycosyltransferase